jgi:hypothetical protein
MKKSILSATKTLLIFLVTGISGAITISGFPIKTTSAKPGDPKKSKGCLRIAFARNLLLLMLLGFSAVVQSQIVCTTHDGAITITAGTGGWAYTRVEATSPFNSDSCIGFYQDNARISTYQLLRSGGVISS